MISEPLTVIDGKFFDSGIRTSKYARWRNNSSSVRETFATDGTLLKQATSGTDGWYLASTGSGDGWDDTQNWTPSFAVEFTIVDMTDGARLRISSEYGNLYSLYNVGDRVKIIYDGSYVDYYKVGSETRLKHAQLNSSTVSIGFSLTNGGTIKFKDFVIYPI